MIKANHVLQQELDEANDTIQALRIELMESLSKQLQQKQQFNTMIRKFKPVLRQRNLVHRRFYLGQTNQRVDQIVIRAEEFFDD